MSHPSGPDLSDLPNMLSGFNNLVGDGTGSVSPGRPVENGNQVGSDSSPIDPRFVRNPSDGGDGWGDNPDTSDVDESANDDFGDLSLRPDSQAVDAGDDSLLPEEHLRSRRWTVTGLNRFRLTSTGNVRVFGVAIGTSGPMEYPLIPGGPRTQTGRLAAPIWDIVRANWGQAVTPGSLLDGDPSGDGIVSGDDLDIVRANWGRSVPGGCRGRPSCLPSPARSLPRRIPFYGPVRRNALAPTQEQTRDSIFDQPTGTRGSRVDGGGGGVEGPAKGDKKTGRWMRCCWNGMDVEKRWQSGHISQVACKPPATGARLSGLFAASFVPLGCASVPSELRDRLRVGVPRRCR